MEQEIKNLSSLILESLRTKGLTVERLSQLSGVSERFLTSLIEGKMEKLPPRPYAHGYLVKVAEALNLDGEKLWADYLKNNEAIRRSGKNDRLPRNRFAVPPFNKKIAVAALALLIVAVYAAVRLPAFFGKPRLTLTNLEDNRTVVREKNFTIKGKINPPSQLTVNDETIYPDRSGSFEKSLELQPGFNTLTFKIKKFLGEERAVTRQIFYQAPEEPPKNENPPLNENTPKNGSD